MATERLADLLDDEREVRRVNVAPPGASTLTLFERLHPDRIRHFLDASQTVRSAVRKAPEAPVLWTAIAPSLLGHFRDLMTTVPNFAEGQPVYGIVHRGDFQQLFRRVATRATALHLVSRLTGLVFLTEPLAEECAPWVPAEKRHVIPNTIDDEVLCTGEELAARREDRPQEPFRILFLSNMIHSKGYLAAARAVLKLRRDNHKVHLTLVGAWQRANDTVHFDELTAGHDEAIHHVGSITDRARIKKLLLESDAFLFPTTYPTEAQPLCVLEAMNAGLPVVATRHAGIPLQLGADYPHYTEPTPDAIAEAVTRLFARDTWQRASRHVRERFEAEYAPEVVREAWVRLIAEARG